MRLRSFRIRGYRCVRDTGEVAVRDITALVGKNESGKTAILEALVLLNHRVRIEKVDLTDGMEDMSRCE